MANININIRMDESLKKEFEAFCKDVGMSMTTAFTLFAKKTVKEYRIPFTIGQDMFNKETREAIENAHNNIGLSKAYNSVEEMLEDLENEDDAED